MQEVVYQEVFFFIIEEHTHGHISFAHQVSVSGIGQNLFQPWYACHGNSSVFVGYCHKTRPSRHHHVNRKLLISQANIFYQCTLRIEVQHWGKTSEVILSSHISSDFNMLNTREPIWRHGLTLIATRISNHMPSKVWYEITYWFPNFNGATVGKYFLGMFMVDISARTLSCHAWYSMEKCQVKESLNYSF